jgi:hypothetical protein
MMTRTDAIAYCEREAARLRSMLPRTTTEDIKARLIERIEELERIAKGEAVQPPDFELTITQSRW